MSLVTKTALKSYFETGDRPSQQNFIDIFDSLLSIHSDVNDTVAGNPTFASGVTVGNGTNSLPLKVQSVSLTLSTSGATTQSNNFFPKHGIPLAFVLKMTVASNPVYVTQVGTDGAPDLFVDSIGNGDLEDADDIISFPGPGLTPGGSDAYGFGVTDLSSPDELLITCNSTPSAGQVTVAMLYVDGAAIV